MRLSNKACALFLNKLRRINGERSALFSQAPFPAQMERKTPGRDPVRQRKTEEETRARKKEWLQSLDYFLQDGGEGVDM